MSELSSTEDELISSDTRTRTNATVDNKSGSEFSFGSFSADKSSISLPSQINLSSTFRKEFYSSLPHSITIKKEWSQGQIIKKLGQGGFGKVYEVNSLTDKKLYALKIVKIADETSKLIPSNLATAMAEVNIVSSLKHQNVIKYDDHWFAFANDDSTDCNDDSTDCDFSFTDGEVDEEDEEGGTETKPFILVPSKLTLCIRQELCIKSLENFLIDRMETLATNEESPDERMQITMIQQLNLSFQLLLAVEYIHSRNIIHRDIKPDNVLIKESEGEVCFVLCDFGLACVHIEDGEHSPDTGTLTYMAPEQITSQNYGKEVDIYACGLVIFVLSSPFFTRTEWQRAESVVKLKERAKVVADTPESTDMLPTILRMINPNKGKRPSATKILEIYRYHGGLGWFLDQFLNNAVTEAMLEADCTEEQQKKAARFLKPDKQPTFDELMKKLEQGSMNLKENQREEEKEKKSKEEKEREEKAEEKLI